MPDPIPSAAASNPSPVPPAPSTEEAAPRGYFNQAQLADIGEAADIAAAAQTPEHATALATQEITPAYVAGLAEALAAAREKVTATSQGADAKKTVTLKLRGTGRALYTALQGIQSAAKQKRRMLEEDDDPATTFSSASTPTAPPSSKTPRPSSPKPPPTPSLATTPRPSKRSATPSKPTKTAPKTAPRPPKKPAKTASPATS